MVYVAPPTASAPDPSFDARSIAVIAGRRFEIVSRRNGLGPTSPTRRRCTAPDAGGPRSPEANFTGRNVHAWLATWTKEAHATRRARAVCRPGRRTPHGRRSPRRP